MIKGNEIIFPTNKKFKKSNKKTHLLYIILRKKMIKLNKN